MLIRKATQDDLSAIQDLNKELFLLEQTFTDSYDINWPHSEHGKKYFSGRIEHENGIVLVASVDLEIVGYVCGIIKDYSYRTINPLAEIENIFVKEKFRKQNIGQSLVNEFKKCAKDKAAKRIFLSSFSKNTNAIDFYKSLGFVHTNSKFELII